jgi:hypothetical protein
VTLVTGLRYMAALDALVDACGRYRAALAAVPSAEVGVSPWTPIYADLLGDLLSEVHRAGRRYDEVAEEVGVSADERYDWQGQLAQPLHEARVV